MDLLASSQTLDRGSITFDGCANAWMMNLLSEGALLLTLHAGAWTSLDVDVHRLPTTRSTCS